MQLRRMWNGYKKRDPRLSSTKWITQLGQQVAKFRIAGMTIQVRVCRASTRPAMTIEY